MKLKLKLKNPDYCDGCKELFDLHTLGGHKRCRPYGKNMLPQDDILLANRGLGSLPRLEKCKQENEVENGPGR